MTQKEAVRRVTQLVLPLCGEAGVSLWDVTFEKEGRQHVLTVYIDKEPAVDIGDCERISRALDPLLDAPEFDSLPPYVLTVSSAGLERPLNREEHLQWALGKEIVLRFYRPLNGARELTVAVGCTGGRHRSVAVAHRLAAHIEALGYTVTESHRDMGR